MVCSAAAFLMLAASCKNIEAHGFVSDVDSEVNGEIAFSLLQTSAVVSFAANTTLVSPRMSTSSNLDDKPDTMSASMYQHVKAQYNAMLETSHGNMGNSYQEPLGATRLHTGQEQKRVFKVVVLVFSFFVMLMAWWGNKGVHECPVSILATISCVGFGLDNFLMAYSSHYLRTPSAHAGVKFVFDGICALGVHCCCLFFRPAYRSQFQEFANSSWRVLMLTTLTGVFIAFGQLTGNIGFNLDTKESGPHQALACSTVLLVSPFFYYYSGEVLTSLQLLGCCAIIAGVTIMSDVNHWADNVVTRYAFQWVFVSMLFYAASVVTWRLAATSETQLPWQPQVLMIFGCVGLVGTVLCPGYFHADSVKEYMQTPALLLWPALNVSVSFLAMWSLQCALQRPEAAAGAITAVVDSNSLVMLTMNRLVLGLQPSFTKAAGMTVILFGCMVVCSEDFVQKSERDLNKKRAGTHDSGAFQDMTCAVTSS